jgi:hypothetical protein
LGFLVENKPSGNSGNEAARIEAYFYFLMNEFWACSFVSQINTQAMPIELILRVSIAMYICLSNKLYIYPGGIRSRFSVPVADALPLFQGSPSGYFQTCDMIATYVGRSRKTYLRNQNAVGGIFSMHVNSSDEFKF